MADTVITIDSQANWETADEMTGCVALDPAGKLTLALDSARVAEDVADGNLAVYVRCREGSGTTLENVGLAGDGTFTPGVWGVRTDGRHYLTGGSASITYHASFAIHDDELDGVPVAYNVSAGIIVRFPSFSAQVLMQRANRFKLGIDADSKPYASYYDENGAWQTATGGTALEADQWYELSMQFRYGFLGIYVDGSLVASVTGVLERDDPGAGDLSVACTGDWTDFYMFGDGESGASYLQQARSGVWEKVYDLATDHSVRHIDVIADRADHEHSLGVSVFFADTEEDLDYVPGYNWAIADTDEGEFHLYPEPVGLVYGRYAKIVVQLSCRNWHRDLPLFDKLVVTFRPVCAPQESWKVELERKKISLKNIEVADPEDLVGLIARYNELQAVVREIAQEVNSYSGGGGGGVVGGGYDDRLAELESSVRDFRMVDNLGSIGMAHPAWGDMFSAGAGASGSGTLGLASVRKNQTDIATLFGNLMDNLRRIASGESRIAALENAGYATTAELTAHADLTTNTHGAVGENGICLEDTAASIAAGLLVLHVDPETYPDPHTMYQLESGLTAAVEAVITAEIAGGQSIDNAIDSLVGTHASLTTNTHGVATANGNFRGLNQIMTLIEGYGYKNEAGVEAVITAELVNGQSIDNRIDTLIGTHAGLSDPHVNYDPASTDQFAITQLIGATVIYLCGAGQSIDNAIDALITAHQGRCTNYAT